MIKDRDDMLKVGKLLNPVLPKEDEDDATSEIETDDEENENWKTIPHKSRGKKRHTKKEQKDTTIICSICNKNFLTENKLKANILRCHGEHFKCCDCDFQANNKHILTNHINLKHHNKDNQLGDTLCCEKCNNQFSDKWNLNNHLRDNHNIKKGICKLYQQKRCSFSSKGCWNSHDESSNEIQKSDRTGQNKCYTCHMDFSSKTGMMKHRKLKHMEEVSECLKFQNGDCGFSDAYCWHKHTAIQDNHNREAQNIVEIETNQDFHKSPENLAPPEHTK